MYVQKFGRKLVKPLRIEKKRIGKKKPKLDKARRLRGIYFIDPDDKEYPDVIKRKKKTGKKYGTSHGL